MRLVSFVLLLSATAAASPEAVNRADALYQRTQYKDAIQILVKDPAPDFATYLLTGKNYFMLAEYKKATEFFEKALAKSPTSSDAELWLGRAWGRRAEGGSPFAVIYASRTRQCFEKAVALDPHNHEAKNDLFDYYLNAPGIMGGGLDKAEAAAKSIAAERPAESEFELAQVAEKRNDFASAEAHLRRAMEIQPTEQGRVIDLARFVAKRGHLEESDKLFALARSLAPHKPGIDFAEAKMNIENHRNPDHARKLLQTYLQANLTPDDPPRQEAEKLLERVGG
jgi:tetratricopeptide (TPR) repeat protein